MSNEFVRYYNTTDKYINYDEIMSNAKSIHCDNVTNSDDAYRYLLSEKDIDMVTFNKVDKILLLNIDALRSDDNGYYFYDYYSKLGIDIVYRVDIMDNIRVHVYSTNNKEKPCKITYFINKDEYQYDELNEIINVASKYSYYTIRITFLEKPSVEDEIHIHSKNYVMNYDFRKTFITNNIQTKTIQYKCGFCRRIPNK
uniref:Uncharacterized protein n=1 Tax=viral metagenome TaxID=1070528 RepID=A0A6C0IR23_9ZZZZ